MWQEAFTIQNLLVISMKLKLALTPTNVFIFIAYCLVFILIGNWPGGKYILFFNILQMIESIYSLKHFLQLVISSACIMCVYEIYYCLDVRTCIIFVCVCVCVCGANAFARCCSCHPFSFNRLTWNSNKINKQQLKQ